MKQTFPLFTLFGLFVALSCLVQGSNAKWGGSTNNNPNIRGIVNKGVGYKMTPTGILTRGWTAFGVGRQDDGVIECKINKKFYVDWGDLGIVGDCTISGTMPANKNISKENLKYNQQFILTAEKGQLYRANGNFGDKIKMNCVTRKR